MNKKGKKIRRAGRVLGFGLAAMVLGAGAAFGQTQTVPKYHSIPAYQMKDVYSNQTVEIGPIPVYDGEKTYSETTVSDDVTFTIWNSTLQKVDQVVTTKDGELPKLKLTEGYDYIFYVLDQDGQRGKRRMNQMYIWVHNGNMYDIKSYEENRQDWQDKHKKQEPTEAQRLSFYNRIEEFKVYNKTFDEDTSRVDGNQNLKNIKLQVASNRDKVGNIFVYYNGKPAEEGVNIIFTSDRETVSAKTDSAGRVHPVLLEDVNYMVSTDDPRYDIEPFPLAAKDKKEYGSPKCFYDHSTCHRVGLRYEVPIIDEKTKQITGYELSDERTDAKNNEPLNPITLLDKGQAHKHDTPLTSMSGKTKVEGMQFKDILLYDQDRKTEIPEFSGKDYVIRDITPVNPHRGEVCKLASGDYTVTTDADRRNVEEMYTLDENGKLEKLDYTQNGNKVSFHLDSLGLKAVVLVGKQNEKGEEPEPEQKPDVHPGKTQAKPVISLNHASFTYNGKVQKPSVIVKAKGKKLAASDYAVSYSSGCKNVGRYTVKVTLKGDYEGSGSATFQIHPKETSLSKLKKGKKSFKVTWKTQKTQTSGYQVQYSTSSKFKSGIKTMAVKGTKAKTKTIKKLKAKKKYYVRIRTYKTVSGKNYYSGWSKAKSVKTK
ncbi:MAG: fibronectin type III domain-containing protein [Eubacteriales bacterium]|nr:fibronectin type III domain-containing protein [Eubacteriales bacterium]